MLRKLFKRHTSSTVNIDEHNVPRHVAIIMDGNGRWQSVLACLGQWDTEQVLMY